MLKKTPVRHQRVLNRAPFRPVVLLLLLVTGGLILRENLRQRPGQLYQTVSGQVEMCLACHQKERLDPAHEVTVLGCSSCHLGDPLAAEKGAAHKGIVKNPGDLRVVERTCGVNGCHAIDVPKVKNSLMATNRGILATMLYYWGEAPDQNSDLSIEELMQSGKTSLALDYFRKLCATCHLWKQKGDLPGFFGEKGGGCTACHYQLDPNPDKPDSSQSPLAGDNSLSVPLTGASSSDLDGGKVPAPTPKGTKLPKEGKEKGHPLLSKKIPVENCVRCHNRSGRIGISYTGVYESEGSGAPIEQGELSSQRLPGDRFYQKLPPDIHYQRGLACIDCHTRNEVMGDGHRYAHFEEQLEIACRSCHTNGRPGLTEKGNQLNNITPVLNQQGLNGAPPAKGLAATKQGVNKTPVLTGKLDNKEHPLKAPLPENCDYTGHQRLSCQACHSTWVPQCYGCHVQRDMNETHLDKLTLKETPGWWSEGRSYIRYEQPALGLWNNRVMPITPGCQDIVTLKNKEGKVERSFNSLTMAAIDPHTTQRAGRTCVDCHSSTKAVGLGLGTAWQEGGSWRFDPTTQPLTTGTGPTPPLDAYVTINGTPLQRSFRSNLRPFNGEELGRILTVGTCLPCHTTIQDKAYNPFRPQGCTNPPGNPIPPWVQRPPSGSHLPSALIERGYNKCDKVEVRP